jgi:pimeloyl-ACP methyl ester carboxylesterase
MKIQMFRFLRLRALATVAGVLLMAVAAIGAFAGSDAVASEWGSTKPTIVLVHGAWADGSSWDGVVGRLQRRGYTVVAPPNPLRGLIADTAYLSSYLQSITVPVVLVGHSYGGAVITNAAVGQANVKALVYVDAYVPDVTDTLFDLTNQFPGTQVTADNLTGVGYPGAATGDFDAYITPSVYRQVFCQDVRAETAATMASTQRPLAFSALFEQSGAPAWKSIPSWDLIGTADNVIPPAAQRFMANRARAHTVEIPSSHASPVSVPDAVTALIVQAAESTAR